MKVYFLCVLCASSTLYHLMRINDIQPLIGLYDAANFKSSRFLHAADATMFAA